MMLREKADHGSFDNVAGAMAVASQPSQNAFLVVSGKRDRPPHDVNSSADITVIVRIAAKVRFAKI